MEELCLINSFFFCADCFKKTITSGMMVAYLTTFAASVVLHGMSFELGAVLLSLGVFAYAEYELRRKLATIFNASIAASRSDIRYRHREGAFHVVLVNCAFGLLATFNLTYLGVIVSREDAMVCLSCTIISSVQHNIECHFTF